VDFVGVNADITMCGNNGDPIYHSDFLNLCKKLKNNNCKITIITNGSSKTKQWWKALNDLLDEHDTLTFSIDGLKDTNHIYRKNAKWESIMNAIDVFSNRKCKLVWKFIVFKHNQHQIKEAKELSTELKFNFFKLEHSDRWLGKKDLMPDREFVDQYYQHQKKVLVDTNYQTSMKPNCLINGKPENQLYIDSEGDFYPCCWIGTYRYKYNSLFSPKQNQFNIKDNNVNDILTNTNVKEFFDSTNQFTSAHDCCKIQCGVKNG
tara:strand:+ start:1095 stop:1880 length:786 start_codon:yes stop_codon:yes gene_type:complete